MAGSKGLRKLTQRFPAPAELRATLDALDNDTDRSVALVAAAIVENLLERVLVASMTHSTPESRRALLGTNGALSNFHSKIAVAEAFGVINSNLAGELHRIRSIRNVFAHAVSPVNFQTPEIVAEMQQFSILRTLETSIRDQLPADLASKIPELFARDKKSYLTTVEFVCTAMDMFHRQKGGSSLIAPYREKITGTGVDPGG